MRKISLILILIPNLLLSQINEEFGIDYKLSESLWEGDIHRFIINSTGELQLNDSDLGSATLRIKSTLSDYIHYNFSLNMDFNPSANNYLKISLLKNSEKEVYMLIGKNNDRVELIYNNNGSEELIISGDDNFLSDDRQKLEFDISKLNEKWVVKIINNNNETNIEFTQNFNFFGTEYFQIQCVYTKTRATKFRFNHFIIEQLNIADNTPPKLIDLSILNANSINLSFSEEILNFNTSNLIISNVNIESISTVDSAAFTISLKENLQSGQDYIFTLKSVKDKYFNELKSLSVEKLYYKAKRGDLVINEIMYNPGNSDDIYGTEYIELFNSSSGKISTSGMILTVNGDDFKLGEQIINFNEMLILLNENPPFLEIDSTVLKLNFRLYRNSNEISLWSSDSSKISSVHFSENDFYKNLKHEDGGWSLEMINPYNYCDGINNYSFCTSLHGGSPQSQNSVFNPDFFSKRETEIKEVLYNDISNTLKIIYNGNLEAASGDSFNLSYELFSFFMSENANSNTIIEIEPEGKSAGYKLICNELTACNEKTVKPDTISFGSYENAEPGDILINEILFKPKNNSSRFIELYNNSDKYFNLNSLFISNFDEYGLSNVKTICKEDRIFPPRSFMVLCDNIASLKENYNTGKLRFFIEPESFPKTGVSEGTIAVLNSSYEVVDNLYYSENMHHPMLNSPAMEGVSLERISTDNQSAGYNNWSSASKSSGGATPALTNSIKMNTIEGSDKTELKTKVFTPNMDGLNDRCIIAFNTSESNVLFNAKVFNIDGAFVCNIAESQIAGTNDYVYWDGSGPDGKIQPKGIYIIWIEFFNLHGVIKNYTFTVVLA